MLGWNLNMPWPVPYNCFNFGSGDYYAIQEYKKYTVELSSFSKPSLNFKIIFQLYPVRLCFQITTYQRCIAYRKI